MARRIISPRSRRATDWGFGIDFADQSITGSSKVLSTTSLGIATPFTLIRMRGSFHMYLVGTAGALGDGFNGAVGIGLVSNEAFGVGITAIPGPQSDANWDGWIWQSFFDIRQITATLSDGANAAAASVRLEVDSKAMRKWDPGMTLVGVCEVVESGSQNMDVQADSRVLLKV